MCKANPLRHRSQIACVAALPEERLSPAIDVAALVHVHAEIGQRDCLRILSLHSSNIRAIDVEGAVYVAKQYRNRECDVAAHTTVAARSSAAGRTACAALSAVRSDAGKDICN